MFVLERTYDIDELVRHNMHTHSILSSCAKKEMTLEAMIRTAEEKGLKTPATVLTPTRDFLNTRSSWKALTQRYGF